MDKIRITHIESGTIHIKMEKYNFIISGSSTKWTDIFNDIEAKPDFWLADIIPEDAINEPSNLMDIHWFSSQSGGFHMKAFAPENVHLLATDEKANLNIYGKIFEIWNIGVGWIVLTDEIKILFTEKAISSNRESWPEDKQNSKLWRYADLSSKFGTFDLRLVDFTSEWIPTDSGEMFEYDIAKKTAIIYSKKITYSLEAFNAFKTVLQFSNDAKNFIILDENETKEIKIV